MDMKSRAAISMPTGVDPAAVAILRLGKEARISRGAEVGRGRHGIVVDSDRSPSRVVMIIVRMIIIMIIAMLMMIMIPRQLTRSCRQADLVGVRHEAHEL